VIALTDGAMDTGIGDCSRADPIIVRRSPGLEAPAENPFIETPRPLDVIRLNVEMHNVVRHDVTLEHPGGVDLAPFCHKMPGMRQKSESELIIRTLAVGYPSGMLLEHHSHSWAQLVYASEGVMTVQTDEGTWVVPSHRAVWILRTSVTRS